MSDHSISANGTICQSIVVTGSGNVVSLVFGSTGVSLPIQRKQVARPTRQQHTGSEVR